MSPADLAPGRGEPLLPLPPLGAGRPARPRCPGRARRPPRRRDGPAATRTPPRARRRTASSPARRRNRSRRKSPWYLFSTAATACSRVISSAATARPAPCACTSSVAENGPSGADADQPGQVGAAGGDAEACAPAPAPTGTPSASTRSTRNRPVGSTRSAAASRCAQVVGQAAARSRPSVEVNSTPASSARATSSAMPARSPPSRTIWVSPVCSASTRARSAGGRIRYQLLGLIPRDRWHNLTSANRSAAH